MFDLPGLVRSGSGMGGGGDQAQAQDSSTSSGPKQTQTNTSINADLRERRFGSLRRIIQVPSTTKVRISRSSNPLRVHLSLSLWET